MTELTEKRAIGFIRTIAGRCAGCLRRNETNCRNCISSWANEIISAYEDDLKAADRKTLDYSLAARMLMITDQLKKAGRPLLACEIDLSAYCTKQLKRWTLQRMIEDGVIGRSVAKKRNIQARYSYYMKKTKVKVEGITI